MRLADIYLMYAESCAAVGGASFKSENCSLTALDAINKIRTRCGAKGVHTSYIADNKKFMDEIRRERAVELSMEGFRFNDPRFYHDIVFDGFHFVLAEDKLSDAQKPYAYCDLSTRSNSTEYFSV